MSVDDQSSFVFWNASQHEIRRTHHKYLVSGKSIVIEVGGNIGDTTQVFLDMYKPNHYVILEPIRLLHRQLLRRFTFYNNAFLYNIGLGASNIEIMIKFRCIPKSMLALPIVMGKIFNTHV
jgi:hypothetical protein